MRTSYDASGVRADDAGDLRRSQDAGDEEGIWREGRSFDIARKSRGGERMKWWKVYTMHFLFMWNSRMYEYVSIVLVALAFPGGLTATSIRGITSTVSTMLCASAVGNWIDRSPSRLPTLLFTIGLNHAAIVASYICWLYWPVIAGSSDEVGGQAQGPFSSLTKGFLYGFILMLDVVHDLTAISNHLSVERDWVPVLVGPVTSDLRYGLTEVNAVMARLQLICKLIAPSILALIVKSFDSRAGWILLLAVLTVFIWMIEVWCARMITRENPELQTLKKPSSDLATAEDLDLEHRYRHLNSGILSWPRKLYFVMYRDPSVRLKHYFSIPMWPASISYALLQLTVLAYSATLITYLLEIKFSLASITIAQASGSIVSLASTFITPLAVKSLRRRHNRAALAKVGDEDDDAGEGKISRTIGFWGIASQFLCLVPVAFVLWSLSPPSTSPQNASASRTPDESKSPYLLAPLILFAFLSLSRIGHHAFQLMVQELGQVEIPESQRSTFAGTEQSFKSLGELCHWAATVVWSQPGQFRWLALGSVLVIGGATVLFGTWAKKPPTRREQHYEGIAMADVDQSASER